jgi:hypothetical protein
MPFLAFLKNKEAFRISLHFPLKISDLQSIRMSGVSSSAISRKERAGTGPQGSPAN